jgi:hypothetical protein
MAKTQADEKPIDYKGICDALVQLLETSYQSVQSDTSPWGHEFRNVIGNFLPELKDKQRRLTNGTV